MRILSEKLQYCDMSDRAIKYYWDAMDKKGFKTIMDIVHYEVRQTGYVLLSNKFLPLGPTCPTIVSTLKFKITCTSL